jgi:hypothetical protein
MFETFKNYQCYYLLQNSCIQKTFTVGFFIRARENFIFKSLRVESMKYCFKSPPPKFQPQIRSKIAHSIKKVKQGFHRFI